MHKVGEIGLLHTMTYLGTQPRAHESAHEKAQELHCWPKSSNVWREASQKRLWAGITIAVCCGLAEVSCRYVLLAGTSSDGLRNLSKPRLSLKPRTARVDSSGSATGFAPSIGLGHSHKHALAPAQRKVVQTTEEER